MKKVSIIGHIAYNENCYDGQTIKTRTITDILRRIIGEEQVVISDTHGGWKTFFKSFYQVLFSLKNSKNIVILLAQNGLRVYVPMLVIGNIFFKRKLHYVVIGGWLSEFLEHRRQLSKALRSFTGIYVETNVMKCALEKQNFDNVYVMSNSKNLNVLEEDMLFYPQNVPYGLCTFSRVMREKGIEEAVKSVETVNKELGCNAYTLDIYGKIDKEQMEWFENLRREFPEYIKYKGVVPFDKSVDVLKKYFALLFLTRYKGEGFAGTIIDAFSAGVPVIATDWKYNSEIVNENVGYIYKIEEQRELIDLLKLIATKPNLILEKKKSCLKEANKYNIDETIKVLLSQIEGD